jgi:hypothetical protein
MSRNFCGKKFPYAAVTIKSTSSARNASRNHSSFAFTGHSILSSAIPRFIASSATGDGAGSALFRPRPRGRPGCDTTAATSNRASALSAASSTRPKTSAAHSGVPKNTNRDFSTPLAPSSVPALRTALARRALIALTARTALVPLVPPHRRGLTARRIPALAVAAHARIARIPTLDAVVRRPPSAASPRPRSSTTDVSARLSLQPIQFLESQSVKYPPSTSKRETRRLVGRRRRASTTDDVARATSRTSDVVDARV